jgi:hypothetical protein
MRAPRKPETVAQLQRTPLCPAFETPIKTADGAGEAMPADRSQEYRRLAAECMKLVRRASDLQVRASLVIMSQRWLEQAELAERALERSLRYRAI